VSNTPGADVQHSRNLDFGAGLGFTDSLRAILVHVVVKRNGTTIAHAQSFAGYVGFLTAMSIGKFSITINTRPEDGNPFVGWSKIVAQYFNHSNAWMPAHLARNTILTASSYAEAGKWLANEPILGRVYFTLGGVNKGEGRVLSRSQNSVAFDSVIGTMPRADWFVLQTNYDWQTPNSIPWFDDRRDSGINAMLLLGQQFVSAEAVIKNVLSVHPTFNQLTTMSVAMRASTGEFVVYGRYCNAPCPF